MFISDRPGASVVPRLSSVRAYLSALAAELVLQSQAAGMSRGLHRSGSGPIIVVQHARMDKKLDPIENAGFQQTCLSRAGQR
jgi:hypothetical protein